MTTEARIVAVAVTLAVVFVAGLAILNVRLRESSAIPLAPIALGPNADTAKTARRSPDRSPSVAGREQVRSSVVPSPVQIFRVVRYSTTTEFNGDTDRDRRRDGR